MKVSLLILSLMLSQVALAQNGPSLKSLCHLLATSKLKAKCKAECQKQGGVNVLVISQGDKSVASPNIYINNRTLETLQKDGRILQLEAVDEMEGYTLSVTLDQANRVLSLKANEIECK